MEELDEILKDEFMGLWMVNPDGEYVYVQDNMDVLKGSLKTSIVEWYHHTLVEAQDNAFKAGYIQGGIDQLNKEVTNAE